MSPDRTPGESYVAERVVAQGISVALTETGLIEIVAHNEFVYLTTDQFRAIAEFVREHPEEDL